MTEAERKKKIREKNKEGVMSFFNKYIAGRKTKLKTKNKENAKSRVENKTKTMSEKNAAQMAKIAKNSKSVGSSQTQAQKSAKAKKDAIAKLMKRVNTPTPKGVSQGSKTSKSAKSSLGYPKVSQGSTTTKKKKPAIVSKAALENELDRTKYAYEKLKDKTSEKAMMMRNKIKDMQKKIKGKKQIPMLPQGKNKGGLIEPTVNQTGLKKLPTAVRNKMGYMYGGGMAKKPRKSMMDYRKGGLVIMIGQSKPMKKGKK